MIRTSTASVLFQLGTLGNLKNAGPLKDIRPLPNGELEAAGCDMFVGDGAVPSVTLSHADIHSFIDEGAWDRLAAIGKAAVEPLIARLSDEDREVREEVVSTLGNIRDSSAIGPLSEILAGKKKPFYLPIIKWASRACWWRGKETPQTFLYRDSDFSIRCAAIEALGNFHDARVMEALLKAVEDPNAYVRGTAVLGLPIYGDVRVLKSLLKVVVDDQTEIRVTAMASLQVYLGMHVGEEAASSDAVKALQWDVTESAMNELGFELQKRPDGTIRWPPKS